MSLRLSAFAALCLFGLASPALAQDQDKMKHAIDRGVAHLMSLQKDDGSWPHHEKIGMTALAGLALLEAGVSKKDPCIRRAAAFVRERIPDTTHTYTVSLAILFLDRLGWDKDLPLLEGLGLRLLMGQNDFGGWSYHCQLPHEKEIGRLEEIARENNADPMPDYKPRELSKNRPIAPEIKTILDKIKKERGTKNNENQHLGDTSNTFFASLALGTVADIGIPVDDAMAQVDRRFGLTINRGGWSYYPGKPPPQQIVVNVPINGDQFNAGNLDPRSNFAALRTVYRSVIIETGRGVNYFLEPPNFQNMARAYASKNIVLKAHSSWAPYKAKEMQRDARLRANVEWVIAADIPIGQVGMVQANLPPIP